MDECKLECCYNMASLAPVGNEKREKVACSFYDLVPEVHTLPLPPAAFKLSNYTVHTQGEKED